MELYEWKVMQAYVNMLLEEDWRSRMRYRRWSVKRFRLWRASYYKNNKICKEDLLQRGVPGNEDLCVSEYSAS